MAGVIPENKALSISPIEKKLKVHLSISFQQAISYTEEKQEKILLSQAKRISHLHEWEIKALLKLCISKEQKQSSSGGKQGNWLKKGMAILFEYASCVDQYWDILARLVNVDNFANNETKYADNALIEHLFSDITLVSYLLAKLLISVCNWRRLQATPRAINIDRLNHIDKGYASTLPYATYTLFQAVQTRLNSLLGDSYAAVASAIRIVYNYLNLDQLIIICAPIMTFEQFIDLAVFDGTSSVVSDETDLELWDLEEDCDSVAVLFAHLRSFFEFENKIDQLNGKGVLDSLLPTLRLPYSQRSRSRTASSESAAIDVEQFTWFKDALPVYGELGKLLTSKLEAQTIVKIKPLPTIYSETAAKLRSLKRHFSPHTIQSQPPSQRQTMSEHTKVDTVFNDAKLLQQEVQKLMKERKQELNPKKISTFHRSDPPESHTSIQRSPANESQRFLHQPGGFQRVSSNAFSPFHTKQSSKNSEPHRSDFSYKTPPYRLQNQSPGASDEKSALSKSHFVSISPILSLPHRTSTKDSLHKALRSIRYSGPLDANTAATKISIWWRYLIPRRRFLLRMLRRALVLEIITETVELAMHKSLIRSKRIMRMLRNGAAAKIQRFLKRKLFSKRPRRSSRRPSNRSRSGSHVMINTDNLEHDFSSRRSSSTQSSTTPVRSVMHNQAAMVIQGTVKQFLVKAQQRRATLNSIRLQRLIMVLCKWVIRRRRRKQKLRNEKAIVIQKIVRGFLTRRHLYRLVRAGVKLNETWRKHMGYKNLKNRLRRIDKPFSIVLKTVSNIPKKTINSAELRIKVSVWWHPLLHIVSANDFGAIVETKRPQLLFISDPFPFLEDTSVAVQAQVEGKSAQSYGVRRLSTVLQMQRRTDKHARMSKIINKKASAGSAKDMFPLSPSAIAAQHDRSSAFSTVSRSRTSSAIHEIEEEHDEDIAVYNQFGVSDGSLANIVKLAVRHSKNCPPVSNEPREVTVQAVASDRKKSALPISPSAMLAAGAGEDKSDSGNSSSSSSDEEVEVVEGDKNFYNRAKVSHNDHVSNAVNQIEHNRFQGKVAAAAAVVDAFGENAFTRPHKLPPLSSRDMTSKEPSPAAQSAGSSVRKKLDESLFLSHTITRSLSWNKLAVEDVDNGTSVPKNAGEAQKSAGPSIIRKVRNSISHFGEKVSNGLMRRSSEASSLSQRLCCNFNDLMVKIPGCHGNSVFKFEILDGERKFATTVFYLNKEGEMMYWGGDYKNEMHVVQQRRGVMVNAAILNTSSEGVSRVPIEMGPILEFKVIAGAPLRSRCQWARVSVRGHGPLKQRLGGNSSIFQNWRRFYASVDQFGLHFFESKYSCIPFFLVPVIDFRTVKVTLGRPTFRGIAKGMQEDLRNVVISTYSGDDIFLRFNDLASTYGWLDVLKVSILHTHENSKELRKKRRSMNSLSQSTWLRNSQFTTALRKGSESLIQLFDANGFRRKSLAAAFSQRFSIPGGSRSSSISQLSNDSDISCHNDKEEDNEEESDDSDAADEKSRGSDVAREREMQAFTGRRSRRYLAPVLQPQAQRSVLSIGESQRQGSQKILGFLV